MELGKSFILPGSIGAITPLVGQILSKFEALREKGEVAQLYVFHNSPHAGAIYSPVCQRLLPFDEAWRRELIRDDLAYQNFA